MYMVSLDYIIFNFLVVAWQKSLHGRIYYRPLSNGSKTQVMMTGNNILQFYPFVIKNKLDSVIVWNK